MTRPNIVLILSDDQGAWAMGCAGNHDLRTPNLDRLALSGIRFTNFFCASPVCSPARASIFTGRMPSQHGVIDWLRSGNIDKNELTHDQQENGVFRDEDIAIQYLKDQKAYTEILAENGYHCALSGKWHLGDSLTPQKGFSHWYTIARGGCGYYTPEMVENGEIKIEERYVTDLITEDALSFLDDQENNEEPFYLSVHYTAPHSPWDREQHPKDIFDSYNDCDFTSIPEEPIHPWQIDSAPHGVGQKRKDLLQGYFAAVTAMDKGIGQILDKIEKMGIRENTLIIFTADNGMNMGHHGIWGKGNGTFPQNMFDTSVKVPGIISHPEAINSGEVCDELLSHYDLTPTLLEYLGIDYTPTENLPGSSFAPILRGEETTERENVVVFDEYGPVRMIRNKEWKYIHRYPYGPHELYDLKNDPNETQNLIHDSSKSSIIEKMKYQLDKWFLKYTDPDRDATKEHVTGKGQLGLVGLQAKGRQAFAQDFYFTNK